MDFRNYTYAKFGREILKQPGGVAFQIYDDKATGWLRKEEYADEVVKAKFTAQSLQDLAAQIYPGDLVTQTAFLTTMKEYNEAVSAHAEENPQQEWNPAVKDGMSTQSFMAPLQLPKSNWALSIDKTPFMAVKVTCGITFTFGGLKIDAETAAVISKHTDRPIPGLFACGEIVGGLFWRNYPGECLRLPGSRHGLIIE